MIDSGRWTVPIEPGRIHYLQICLNCTPYFFADYFKSPNIVSLLAFLYGPHSIASFQAGMDRIQYWIVVLKGCEASKVSVKSKIGSFCALLPLFEVV